MIFLNQEKSGLEIVCQIAELEMWILCLKAEGFGKVCFLELLMRHGIGKSGFMSFGYHEVIYLGHDVVVVGINTCFDKVLPYKTGGHVVGVDEVDIVVAIIAEYIDNEFISGEVVYVWVHGAELMYCLYEACLATVVVGDTIANVADGAYGKKYIGLRVDAGYIIDAGAECSDNVGDGQHAFLEPLCRCSVVVGNG